MLLPYVYCFVATNAYVVAYAPLLFQFVRNRSGLLSKFISINASEKFLDLFFLRGGETGSSGGGTSLALLCPAVLFILRQTFLREGDGFSNLHPAGLRVVLLWNPCVAAAGCYTIDCYAITGVKLNGFISSSLAYILAAIKSVSFPEVGFIWPYTGPGQMK